MAVTGFRRAGGSAPPLGGEGWLGRASVLRRGEDGGTGSVAAHEGGHHGDFYKAEAAVLYGRWPKGKPREQGATRVREKEDKNPAKLWKVPSQDDSHMEFVIHVWRWSSQGGGGGA